MWTTATAGWDAVLTMPNPRYLHGYATFAFWAKLKMNPISLLFANIASG
jgi:hypothetical protein